MTIEEAKQAHMNGAVVIYHGVEHYIDHIQTRYSKSEHRWYNSLYLVPCDNKKTATVARMRDCELKGSGEVG